MRPGGKGVLVLDNITKKYELGDATVSALGGVSMSIKSGERASIMGPSGSGKSTLLHMLGLLDNPTSGAIYIDGVSTSNMEDAALAK
ncbi:ATP-binding cassette domain-containing protein, partial [Candidatus Parvarchaeota archaeon]|nr:ATP-binding cassette domain-containing protein [Candidatus Parvarchaeota archaeon]